MRNLKKKRMKIFSILKVDDEYTLKQFPSLEQRVDPSADSLNRSGVTTTSLDGVSVLLIEIQIF
jgi:hypothetical protein